MNTTNAIEVAAQIQAAAAFARASGKSLKEDFSVMGWSSIRDQFGLGLITVDVLIVARDITRGKVTATTTALEIKPVTTTTTKAPRSKIMGYAPTAVLRWMGSKGWDTEKAARAIFELGGEHIADGTIRIQLTRGKKGVGGYIPALTPYQVRKANAAAK